MAQGFGDERAKDVRAYAVSCCNMVFRVATCRTPARSAPAIKCIEQPVEDGRATRGFSASTEDSRVLVQLSEIGLNHRIEACCKCMSIKRDNFE